MTTDQNTTAFPKRHAKDATVFACQLAYVAHVADEPLAPTIVADYADELMAIATRLHRIHERQCNGYEAIVFGRKDGNVWDGDAEARDLVREERLTDRARKIAAVFGVRAIIQGDPRGAALRLAAHSDVADANGPGVLYVPQAAR